MSFQSRLRDRRRELNLSRLQLAKKLNITVSAIANYETGVSHPKTDILFRLISALDCDANYLFQDEIVYQKASSYQKNRQELDMRETRLLSNYRSLNKTGRDKVDCYLKDIVCNPENVH